jgi:hypothetical protein
MDSSQQPKNDFERARQALRIMQAALEKAKTNHGDLYTFGDCASVYAAMMNMNNFIDKTEQLSQQPQENQNVSVAQSPQQPQLQLNQPFQTTTVNYSTN